MEEPSKAIQTNAEQKPLCIGHPHPGTRSLGRVFLGSLSEPAAASHDLSTVRFLLMSGALVKQREEAGSTQTAAFRSLVSVLLCFAAQPCLHKRCWKLIPPEFQKFREGKNFTNQRCFFCSFLVPGVVSIAGMGFASPALQCQHQEMGKVTPVLSEKEESGL